MFLKMVLENEDLVVEVEQLKFTRNKKNQTVQTDVQMKSYGFVYDKQDLFEDLSNLPYRFKV